MLGPPGKAQVTDRPNVQAGESKAGDHLAPAPRISVPRRARQIAWHAVTRFAPPHI
jgi:hypothetical protein